MTAEKTEQLYTQLVYWVADEAPADWRTVRINMEMLLENGEVANSWATYCKVGDDMQDVEMEASAVKEIELRNLFRALNDLSAESGDRWTVCDFTVNSTGQYNVDYSYDPPPRLSGDLRAY